MPSSSTFFFSNHFFALSNFPFFLFLILSFSLIPFSELKCASTLTSECQNNDAPKTFQVFFSQLWGFLLLLPSFRVRINGCLKIYLELILLKKSTNWTTLYRVQTSFLVTFWQFGQKYNQPFFCAGPQLIFLLSQHDTRPGQCTQNFTEFPFTGMGKITIIFFFKMKFTSFKWLFFLIWETVTEKISP